MKILDRVAERLPEKYALHDQYLNGQLVRVLKTIGFDVAYTEARGPYLFERPGQPLPRPALGLGRVRDRPQPPERRRGAQRRAPRRAARTWSRWT